MPPPIVQQPGMQQPMQPMMQPGGAVQVTGVPMGAQQVGGQQMGNGGETY
jgi:hypothetical protein